MKRLMLALMMGAAFLGGCGGEPEPPPPPPEAQLPPEPTQDEIYGQLREAVSILFTTAQQPAGDVSEALKSQAITKLQSLLAKHRTSQNGPAAIRRLQGEVEAIVTQMRDAQRWATLKSAVDFFKVFEPGSDKYLAYVERANLMIARPQVEVKGFFELSDGLYAFLEVTDKTSGEKAAYKVREGEEFHNGVLRLVRIIGNKHSVEIEYTPIEETWVVVGPGA